MIASIAHQSISMRRHLQTFFSVTLLIALFVACREKTPETANASSLEKITPTKNNDDLRALLATEIQSGKKRIVIPPGRYRVKAEKGSHLVFSGLRDLEIIADGVELICTSTIRALHWENCSGVTLRGLTIDYDPLPFSQGRIIAMAPDKSWIDFVIAQGYPDTRLRGPFQIYDPATATLRRDDARWEEEVKPLGDQRFRITKATRYRFDPAKDTEQLGDIVVAKSSTGESASPHAVELHDCKNMRFEAVKIHASPSFGFLERDCHATTYLRCVIDRRAAAHDFIDRALPRMRSMNADAFHSKDATTGPSILSCSARFQGDDCVNINGRYQFIRSAEGREVRIFVIDPKATLLVGDTVEFLPFSGTRPEDAKIVQKRPDAQALTEAEIAFIGTLSMDRKMRDSLLQSKAKCFTLTLDREITLAPGSLLACPQRLGRGFAVKDCDFGDNRSRGILIKASHGEVSGNRIRHTGMSAILVSPEFWWMEAGLSSHVTIQDNHISHSGETPIEIHAHGGNRKVLPAGALKNISLLRNRIEHSAWPLIHVTSTTGLRIEENTLPTAPPTPDHKPIVLEQCETP
jgi:hypothetical protein